MSHAIGCGLAAVAAALVGAAVLYGPWQVLAGVLGALVVPPLAAGLVDAVEGDADRDRNS